MPLTYCPLSLILLLTNIVLRIVFAFSRIMSFGIMKEHFLKHVICDSGRFLLLSFPEVNDPDANMQIWYQLKENNFFQAWEH